MGKKIHILGIAGSLRKQSFNRKLLETASQELPPNCDLEIFDLKEIPLYNQDEENPLPQEVSRFKAKIRAADAILITTPEYNYSISGILKNALDWGSRPYGDNSWDDKAVAIMGASMGAQGTCRAQYHLRQVFVYLNMHPINRPEIMIGMAQDQFDAKGILTDPKTRQKIGELLSELVSCARRRL